MAETIDVKQWMLQVESDTPSTFAEVTGMQGLTLSESTDENEVTVDGSEYKQYMDGDKDWSIAFDGLRLEDVTTGARPEGQRLVEKTSRTRATRTFRLAARNSATTNYIEADCKVMLGDFGGSRNGANAWSFTLRLAPSAVPTYNGPMFDMDDASYTP